MFFHYVAAREELVTAATRLFEVVASGAVKVDVGQSYALWDAAAAHRDLEGAQDDRIDAAHSLDPVLEPPSRFR